MRPQTQANYETVRPSRVQRSQDAVTAISSRPRQTVLNAGGRREEKARGTEAVTVPQLKRGHQFSFAALFAFTFVLYGRPSDFSPSPILAYMALGVGLITLAFYLPTQFALEGKITAAIREAHLVLLFGVLGLINIPLAMNPAAAWEEFHGTFIRCIVIFVVAVNVTRTERRLKSLMLLTVASAVWLSVQALNDYRTGLLTVEGYRVAGKGLGLFANSNDMALHLVTVLPISVAFAFVSRSKIAKIVFGIFSAMIVAGVVVSYSRGAFLALVVTLIALALKLARRNRLAIVVGIVFCGLAFMLFAPGNYLGRISSIFIPSLDTSGSADARRSELFRSLYVAIRHPVFGIGMGNYATQMSYFGTVTHNAYTQVAAEMGAFAFACYLAFIVSPLRKLARITRETFDANRRFHYLAVGLLCSLIAYMVASFFLSVAYNWYVYYLVAYAVCLRRLYEAETGKAVIVETRKDRKRAAREAVAQVQLQSA